MKNQIILWLSAIVITFFVIYSANLFSRYYPITGTFGIEGKKVSYRFENQHFGKEPYNILIRTDVENLSGTFNWKKSGAGVWETDSLKYSDQTLIGSFLADTAGSAAEFYVELIYKDKLIRIPDTGNYKVEFWGEIPKAVGVLNFLFLYLGLLLAIRTGLEYFSNDNKIKKYSFSTSAVLLLFTVMLHPLYLSYKSGAINHSIPQIGALFPAPVFSLFLLWVIVNIILFNSAKLKIAGLIASVITIALYFLIIY